MENLEVCVFLEISKIQRHNELLRGLDKSCTSGYEKTGCYDCSGLNNKCDKYINYTEVKYGKQ